MIPSPPNNDSKIEIIDLSVNRSDALSKNTDVSSNSKGRKEGTSINLEDDQSNANGNAINQEKVQKNHKGKAGSVVTIGDSMIKHENGWKI